MGCYYFSTAANFDVATGPDKEASPEQDERKATRTAIFTKVGGKCDTADYFIFTFLCSALSHYNLDTEIRLAGGWVRDRLMFSNEHVKSNMDFVLSDIQGGAFCKLLKEYARTGKSDGNNSTGMVSIQTKGNKGAIWLGNRELRFEKRVAPTWEEEAKRRDFTINSLFYNLHDGTVEDYTGHGLDDLADRVLRTTTPYAVPWLIYDPVRVLRAIRFSRSFNLTVEPGLESAMCHPKVQQSFNTNVELLPRRETELRKMILHKNSTNMYRDLVRFNLHQALFRFPESLSSGDDVTTLMVGPPSAMIAFTSLPPLAAEVSLPVNPWNEHTTIKAISSVIYLRKLLPRTVYKDGLETGMASLLAFVSPVLLANWSGYTPFGAGLVSTTVSAVKSSIDLPHAWARELRGLLNATVDLLHIAHEFIPTISVYHRMSDGDDLSELESGYSTLVHHRRHDLLHWLRHNRERWQLATLLAHTMLVHGSPRYHFDFKLFAQALQDTGVSEAAYIDPMLDGNELKDLLPPELHGKHIGGLLEALVSWQWDAAKPTKEGAVAFVREYSNRAKAERRRNPKNK